MTIKITTLNWDTWRFKYYFGCFLGSMGVSWIYGFILQSFWAKFWIFIALIGLTIIGDAIQQKKDEKT